MIRLAAPLPARAPILPARLPARVAGWQFFQDLTNPLFDQFVRVSVGLSSQVVVDLRIDWCD